MIIRLRRQNPYSCQESLNFSSHKSVDSSSIEGQLYIEKHATNKSSENVPPRIVKANTLSESFTPERCFVYENWGFVSAGDKTVSIARARVKPKVTTKEHHLEGVQEIYIVTSGNGKVYVGNIGPTDVSEGDTIIIPAGVSQKITNTGKNDLIFYCVCTPAFTQECYHKEEVETT